MTVLNIPVEQINAEARKLDPVKVALTALVLVPFLLGWTARKVWLLLAWTWTAVLAGWREAGRPRPVEDDADR